jgi:microsomal prostaglandin-E synthase 1
MLSDLPFNVSPTLLLALPALRLYALCAVILVLKMFVVSMYSGVVRGRLKVAMNPEDAARFGTQLVETEPAEVARVLRAHRNDLENIPGFLLLGLVAVMMGAPALALKISLIVFTAARVAHSIAYLKSMQPWRSMTFGVGVLSMLTVMGLVLVRVFT